MPRLSEAHTCSQGKLMGTDPVSCQSHPRVPRKLVPDPVSRLHALLDKHLNGTYSVSGTEQAARKTTRLRMALPCPHGAAILSGWSVEWDFRGVTIKLSPEG